MEWPSARDRLREDRPRERAEHGDRRDPPGSDVDPDVVLATRDDAQTWDRRRASSSPRTTRRGRASRLARRRRRARDFIFQGRRRPGVAYARRRTTRRAVRRVRDVPRRRGGELRATRRLRRDVDLVELRRGAVVRPDAPSTVAVMSLAVSASLIAPRASLAVARGDARARRAPALRVRASSTEGDASCIVTSLPSDVSLRRNLKRSCITSVRVRTSSSCFQIQRL